MRTTTTNWLIKLNQCLQRNWLSNPFTIHLSAIAIDNAYFEQFPILFITID